MTNTRARVLKGCLYLGGGVALALAFAETWERQQDFAVFPGWSRLSLALGLMLLAFHLVGSAWVRLFEGDGDRRVLRTGFYASQLGKYLPGAIWQPAGLVALAPASIGVLRASTTFGVFSLTLVISAAVAGSTLGFIISELSPPLRWLPLLGLGTVPLLGRAWMVRALNALSRRFPRVDMHGLVPGQRSILASAAANMVALLLQGCALGVLLSGNISNASIAGVIPAFSFAWMVGFLALPLPAGIGLREAVLVAALGPVVGAPAVLAAAVAHRLVGILAEAALVLASSPLTRRPRRSGALEPNPWESGEPRC